MSYTRLRGPWFLCSRGIGDTVVFLSKLKKYREDNPGKEINLIAADKHKVLLEAYSKYIDHKYFISYSEACKTTSIAFSKRLPSNITYILPSESTELLGYKNISISDLMNIRLGLPEFTGLVKPEFTCKYTSFTHFTKERHLDLLPFKYALLAPSAVSVNDNGDILWKQICELLESHGISVVINSDIIEMGLEKYKHVTLPLDDTYYLADYAAVFIGLRNGLCDLLAFARCDMIVAYPNEIYQVKFSLNNMDFEKHIIETLSVQLHEKVKEYLEEKINGN